MAAMCGPRPALELEAGDFRLAGDTSGGSSTYGYDFERTIDVSASLEERSKVYHHLHSSVEGLGMRLDHQLMIGPQSGHFGCQRCRCAASSAEQIAGKSIRRYRWRWLRGLKLAGSIGGVKERQQWFGRVRGADGRQRWIRAVDLRPASGSQP